MRWNHLLGSLILLALPVRADGLADLKQALGALSGTSPVKGTLEVRTWNRDTDTQEKTGQAQAWVEDGSQGLRMAWRPELLQRMAQERRSKHLNAEVPTPILDALNAMEPKDVAEQVQAAPVLLAQLQEAKVKMETTEAWNGQPTRVLLLELPPPGMTPRQRKMLKTFQASLKVWLGADGLPLETQAQQTVKGSALVVIHFSQESTERCTFAKVGQRLVCTLKEVQTSTSGGGEHGSSRILRHFKTQE